ncbi:MAG TPA: hybrid sensor histidine kinase/response regulator [Gemmatimonas aurantiaca]|uniref:histidine kinase n=2 Tax=Gemmatimonas aurantiaca TaxID=173480 RepID=C1A6E9_GEMAT|nr:putative two-component hybrid sensor and regulator [Gemmatimonas aurantiaca T-27]HCT56587.1 hybrid sensor histidine kinase/response regulator [Gemmatimonas aurantiaca]
MGSVTVPAFVPGAAARAAHAGRPCGSPVWAAHTRAPPDSCRTSPPDRRRLGGHITEAALFPSVSAIPPSAVTALIDAANTLGGALLVFDDQGRIVGANAQAAELFGLSRRGALPLPYAELRDQHAEFVGWLDASFAGRQATPFELNAACGGVPCWWTSVLTQAPASTDDAESARWWLWRAHDITAWRAPQRFVPEQAHMAALAESEARLRGVLDAGFDAVCVVRAVRSVDGTIRDFLILDANRLAGERAGMAREAMIGQPVLTVFPKSRDWGLWEECCRVLLTREPLETTHAAPIDDQPVRWLQRQIVPVDVESLAISSRDVTDRHVEQMAIAASEERHRQLFENNGAMQLLVDAETSLILDVNASAEAFYGWSRATMRGMYVTDLDAAPLEHWRTVVAKIAIGTGTRVAQDHRLATGERRRVETFLGVAEISGRRAVHIIVQDITDRAQAERRLRESEAQFRAVINGMREGVLLYDEAGVIRVCNPSAERILDIEASRLIGSEPSRIDWHAQREDGSTWPQDAPPGLVALHSGQSQMQQLMAIQRKDGETTWISVTAEPIVRNGESKAHGAVSVFNDVTETRASSERLQQMQKLEAIAQLAGGIAHDFNNLLTVITGATSFLRDSLDTESPLLEDIAAIERASERAEELTRQLLAVGRRQMLHTELVEMNHYLRELQPSIRELLPDAVELRYELSATPVAAALDRSRLGDAILALVANAGAAMPTGGVLTLTTQDVVCPHPHDHAVGARRRPYVVLAVQDTGAGMDDGTRARLFEPFFSTQPFGNSRGMGLASVHGMVHQSRGFIECDSVPGMGTTLRLFFPMSGTPQTVCAVEPRSESRQSSSGAVLVVDDDPMLRELGRRMIEKIGEFAFTAASGAEALAFLEQRAGDVSTVVTDLTMPDMGGLELIATLSERYPTIPVVAISGFTVQVGARAALDARQVPFVAKPFTIPELAQALAVARARHADSATR